MIKKSRLNNLKKKMISLCVAIGLFASAFVGLSAGNFQSVSAYNKSKTSEFFSDANFTSYSGSSPSTPSQWSLIDNAGNYHTEFMTAGIFSSKSVNETYLKNYKVVDNPELPVSTAVSDNSNYYYSLSMSAPYASGGNFGYKPTSSKITLDKNSFYSISVTLKTINMADTTSGAGHVDGYADSFNTRASIYLSGLSDAEAEKNAKFEMIDSRFGKDVYNGWGTFTFYVATNAFKGESSLDLELWLGSKTEVSTGTVFFNSVSAYQLDQNTFTTLSKNSGNNKKVIDLRSPVNTAPIENSNFAETWTKGWKAINYDGNDSIITDIDTKSFRDSTYYNKYELNSQDLSQTNLRSDDSKVLFMANSESTYTGVESKSEIKFERQKYYKLSVWAWSNTTSGTNIKTKLVNTTDKITLDDASLTISTGCVVDNSATNGWIEYSFYIYGHSHQDVTAKLQLLLGDEETPATGYVYFDNITLEEISFTQYNDNYSSSNSTEFSYNKADSDYTVSNYTFNMTQNEENNNTYPLAPTNWTYDDDSIATDVTISGVVNTNSGLFNANDLKVGATTPKNPSDLPYMDSDSYNNVLMLGSRYYTTQSYTSNTFTLEANSYYRISMYVNATLGGAKIEVKNDKGVLFSKSDITSAGWTHFVTYVKTASAEDSMTVVLSLENQDGTARFAFFDDIIVEKSEESTFTGIQNTENYNNIYSGTFYTKIDRFSFNFDQFETGKLDGFEENEASDNTSASIVDLSTNEYNTPANTGKNALVVSSNDEVNGSYYYVTTKNAYTLNGYYKITVYVKTINMNKGGATITLAGDKLNKSFTEINTDEANRNAWTPYTFFVNATTETSATLQLGLGNSENKACGYALFDDITIEKLTDEAEFKSLTSAIDETTQQIVETVSEDTTESEDTAKEEDKFEGSFNWYIVTSLITALAIIIAVVGVFVRKINWKHSKKVKTAYDRRKTLDVSLNRQERIARRQEEIRELEKQLKEIEDDIAGIKRDVEEDIAKYKEQHDEAKSLIVERRDAILSEKEQALHARNEKIAKDKKAFTREEEEKFANYIKKLDLSVEKENKEISKHDKAVSEYRSKHNQKLQRYIAKKEFIKAEIARIDAEIEAIAKEEAQIWEEYKQAKLDAKQRKAEYKASLKAEKEKSKTKKTEEIKEDVEIVEPDKEDK